MWGVARVCFLRAWKMMLMRWLIYLSGVVRLVLFIDFCKRPFSEADCRLHGTLEATDRLVLGNS